MTRPFPDTNEPLPPELKRTLDFWRCSNHCWVGSNWYFSLSCLSGGALKSHIPSSASADATQTIAHATASGPSFREVPEAVNIGKHKMLTDARQPWFYHLAIMPRPGPGCNRSNSTPGISDARFRLRTPRHPTTAIAASEAMKRTTIVISKKVNVPRMNSFKAAAIAV